MGFEFRKSWVKYGSVTLPQPYEYGSFRFQENEETFLSGAKGRVKRFYLAYDNDSRDKTYHVYCGFPNQYILNKLNEVKNAQIYSLKTTGGFW